VNLWYHFDDNQINVTQRGALKMAKITIDGKEYESDDLPDEVKSQLAALQDIDRQMGTLRNQMAVQNMARTGFAAALKESLEKHNKG